LLNMDEEVELVGSWTMNTECKNNDCYVGTYLVSPPGETLKESIYYIAAQDHSLFHIWLL
jgi:energy-converting hydrogenase Eha subunit F